MRHSHESHRIRFVRTGVYRRLDAELTHEIMDAMALGLHDRLVAPYSLAGSEEFGQEGWHWRFPADASEATKVGDD